MRRRDHSLRTRLAAAFVLLTLLLCTFFSLTCRFAVQIAEKQLINERLEKSATQLIQQYRLHVLPSALEDNFFVNDEIPEQFRHLRPGVHEMRDKDGETTVYISKSGGDVFAVTDDTSDYEITEHLIYLTLGAGFVTSVLLAMALGFLTAQRIVAPIAALAKAVDRNDPPSALPALAMRNEIGTLARAFANRTEQLQQFLADEKLFTGDVSHEMRTPLTIILGAAELLKVQLADAPEKMATAERIRRVAAEASERVGAMLLLSQSPQALRGTPLSLTHLVEREFERCQQLLAGKPVQIHFRSDEEVWVHARMELAGIAIGNLLRNACQYTEQGMVTVVLSPSHLVIEDNGPGIPDNVRERLFERFVRGSEQKHIGSGLGLAIVKRVCDHLGWQVRYDRPADGGSRFTLLFADTARALPHEGEVRPGE
ncbi:MAG TPA: HAMP domain-containing sensor histidine kinase [Oxalicibacterium sp.]|nr:HAMP domain-containing sensor histidine kinase [Oxalicibacterium sp.]